MPNSDHGANFLADQRYYHFVFAKDTRGIRLADYWRRVGRTASAGFEVSYKGEKSELEHRKLKLDRAFARGAVAEALSEDGRGRPPYLYDLIAVATETRGERYLAFGFPFVGLGLEIIRRLSGQDGFFRSGELLGVNVPKLIATAEKGLPRFDAMSTHVVGVQFIVTDDKSLTAVRLGGDDPLGAQIYVEFLRKKVEAGFFLPDKCVLACEREWQDGAPAERSRAFRSRLHVAGDGHFKFYAHAGCNNLRLVPYALGQLKALGCFQKVHGNPLARLDQEET